MKIAFFTTALSRKNGGSSSIVDLSLAALNIGRLSAVYSPLGVLDYLYYRASGSAPLVPYTKFINLRNYADNTFGSVSKKVLKSNRLISFVARKMIIEPNTIYIDDLGVSLQIADNIKKNGGVLILNHAGSSAAFINHFGCAKYTRQNLRMQRYKYLLSRYDYCLFQSQSQIDEYNCLLGDASSFPRTLLIEPSCYEPDIQAAIKKKMRFGDANLNIAVIGTIQPRKNQFSLIAVCKELIKLNVIPKFHVVGGIADNDYYVEITKAIEKDNLSEFFSFYGHRRDYLQIMAGCSIVLQPSVEEGVSRILRESLALGKPIVAYNITGTNGLLINNGTGFLAELHDTASMALFCKQLNDSTDLYRKISNLCSQLFEDKFSMHGLSTKLIEVIGNVEKF